MIKFSDLVLAVGILAFFLLIDEKENKSYDSNEVRIETSQFNTIPLDSLSRFDVYDSYADYTY